MQRYFFNAMLTTDQCYGYYRGEISYVVVTTDNGTRVQLAFRHFQPFVDSNGIRGRFRLTISEQGAFISLEKIN
ncbi:DUF2835 family protein [Rheinheimera baltica]|uniref:DUF2835 family protein n=1 Tax=Rheinheimera baltica TaxID=67576 RepID=A0ABT9HWD9_9GAMM|nr:DUF2835 family protein [Rheinheimera baltica]MDP5135449.1 DUF2835 family protein [Rheinheimera baltica]MDP5143498.1 DUF2835 family protein [Rheinheimera baltica]MDP5149208.1 DUF2835 family protein [Rheinheimera baltica]MDP5190434.1 DUF2835 family protein [Rheinheimera baltica]